MSYPSPRATEAALSAQQPLPGQSRPDLREQAARLREQQAPREQRAAPVETGIRLATARRSDTEELRITWDEYEGRPFVSIRLWASQDGGSSFWPVRGKGLSIRLRELPDLADGVARAVEMAMEQRAGREARG